MLAETRVRRRVKRLILSVRRPRMRTILGAEADAHRTVRVAEVARLHCSGNGKCQQCTPASSNSRSTPNQLPGTAAGFANDGCSPVGVITMRVRLPKAAAPLRRHHRRQSVYNILESSQMATPKRRTDRVRYLGRECSLSHRLEGGLKSASGAWE